MREFIRLQLKLKWGFNRNNNKASAIMTAAATLFAVVVCLALVWTLSFVLKSSVSVTSKRLFVMYLTVLLFGLTVAATGMQMKRLYRPSDLPIAARFPIGPFKLFLGYLVLNYIDLAVYSAIFLLPVAVVFGVAVRCFTLVFVLGALLGALLMPLLPFGLSIFIAIPLVYVARLLEKYGTLRILLFVAFLVGAFALYYYLLTILAQFFIHRNWEQGTLEIWRKLLAALDGYANPAYYLGNAIFFENFLLGFGVWTGAGVALTAGGIALARAVCARFRDQALDSGSVLPARRTEIDGYGSELSIFRFRFREILRSGTYSYFYLGVAISTPVMVFFCNRLVTMVGAAQIGAGINFGASMLVVAVFMAMICSFSGTILSVEGKHFYITKLIPVSYRTQLLIKGLLHVAVSAVALAISAVVMGSLGFLDAKEMTVLVLTQILLVAGLVFNGINLNLANPNLKPKANGEAEEINITYMLLIGLVLAALFGACCIILPKSVAHGATVAYLTAVFGALLYAAVNILVFWFTAEKKYRRIEI